MQCRYHVPEKQRRCHQMHLPAKAMNRHRNGRLKLTRNSCRNGRPMSLNTLRKLLYNQTIRWSVEKPVGCTSFNWKACHFSNVATTIVSRCFASDDELSRMSCSCTCNKSMGGTPCCIVHKTMLPLSNSENIPWVIEDRTCLQIEKPNPRNPNTC